MKRQRSFLASPFSFLCFFLFLTLPLYGKALSSENVTKEEESPVMGKSQRRRLLSTEYGEVSAIDIKDGHRAPFHLQFFTLEPNSLFLPVLLHADMLFYVHTGSGRLIWAYDGDTRTIKLRRGDICMLGAGHVFYLQSNLEAQRERLRIFAIFPNSIHNHYDPAIGAYSRISELVGGFDQKIMQAAFGVSEQLAAEISNKTETPTIVHAVWKEKNNILELEAWILNRVFGGEIATDLSFNNNKPRTYNVFDKKPDFKNRYGWSLMVTQKHLKSLKHINIGFLMVNLIAGAMMGPHWNPLATEIAMVLEGEGMVRVVCGSSNMDKSKCQNIRFKVKQGDVFVVPRFHPMAQMSFTNDSLVFLGFSTTTKKTYPQFLAGERSVLQTIDKHILAASFNVSDETIEKLLDSQEGSIILGCASCAEEEERIMIEEAKRRREEEEARRREEQKRREEEEEAKRREEEKRRQEEEEARKREEEKRRQEEEARREAEEEQKREEEEEARREAEDERAKEEQEEAKRQQERREEERERRRREEEAKREQERATRQQEEEAEMEQERAKKEQEERERKRQQEGAKEEEEQVTRKQEEEAEMEQERAKKEQQERERKRQQEEAEEAEEEEEQARRKQEEEAEMEQHRARKEQEERERKRQQEEAEEEEEQARRKQEEEAEMEQEQARKDQEERERKPRKEEAEAEEEQVTRKQEEAEMEQERAKKEREEKERKPRKEEAEAEEEQVTRKQEEEAEMEQERAKKEQEERERKRQQEAKEEEEQARRKQEEEAETEQERATKEQEERERKRQQEEEEEKEQTSREIEEKERRRQQEEEEELQEEAEREQDRS